MSSRKRKNSRIPEIDRNTSKRARLLSNLWKSQEDYSESTWRSHSTVPSRVYKIKAIIGERPRDYLIDWADDPATGEAFTPDWQPKANVNTAAIKAWQKKTASALRLSNSRPRRHRRRRRRPASVSGNTASVIRGHGRNPQSSNITETPNHELGNGSSRVPSTIATSTDSEPPCSEPTDHPIVAVQVSQHSNFDTHIDNIYCSSLSSVGDNSSSIPDHPGPGVGESSSEPDNPLPLATQRICIVPDSQSLPGSSSYVPISRNSSSNRVANTTSLNSSSVSTAAAGSKILTSTILRPSSIGGPPTANGTLGNSSLIEVAASQPSIGQSSEIVIAATQQSVTDLSIPSVSVASTAVVNWQTKGVKKHIECSQSDSPSLTETVRTRDSEVNVLEISEDHANNSHPSQATTTDESIVSLRDPNSQTTPPYQLEQSKEDLHEDSSSDSIKAMVPTSLDSQEPPQPPSTSDTKMTDLSLGHGNFEGALEPLSTREKLKRMREASAAKKEAARKGQQLSSLNTRALPSMNMERQPSQSSLGQGSPSVLQAAPHPAHSPSTRIAPAPLARVQGEQPLSPVGRAITISSRDPSQQPRSPISGRGLSQQPLSPAAQPSAVWVGDQQPAAASGTASPAHDHLHVQVQSPVGIQSRDDTNTPEIPDKLAYQAQEEPERLEVQPILISTELPLPMRSSQSLPHTPATPSRLAMHAEASASQTMTLEPRNLGKKEFIIPLCMQKRILQQYIDTMSYYTNSITENMTKRSLSDKCISNLNTLLGRLADVSTHIGLEGGGPGSQDSVKSEQEATYAEMSSEKFKFLGCLFETAKDDNIHIALIAKSGPLHDIIEMFLKGKKVSYNRPATFSRSDPRTARGHLQVSLLASGQGDKNPIEVARKADLVIALDETFNSKDSQVVDLRNNNTGGLAPVIRLIIFASVEHLDLCLPRTLEPVDRLRKLISCVWHTQSIVGELKDNEPDAQTCATTVATLLRGNAQIANWRLPNIQPIQNLPVMDSDSSLSDAISDVSVQLGRPSESARKYWPYNASSTAANPYGSVVQSDSNARPNGKRAYDLEYGDSLEVQAKKQKMAQRAHAGLPLEEPRTTENLEKWLAEGKAREQRLMQDLVLWKDTAVSHAKWAEARQFEYEDLRDRWSNLHHDKLELKAENAKLAKDIEKARLDRMNLQGEHGILKKDLDDSRQQLINHPVPSVAEKAQSDARIRTLEEENAVTKKKLDVANGQLDYTRKLYQDSSNIAAELASELESLKKIFEPTKFKLEHEIRRRKHERETDPRTQQLQLAHQEKQTLRAEIEAKDRLIKRKEDQITVLERGRGAGVQTRGNSVQPRSPRGAGSRGASPAAAMLGGTGGSSSKGPSGLSGQLNME